MTTYTSNPTAENTGISNDELTALLNEERYARTLTNIARRAGNLWADGYRWSKFAEGFYLVFSPKAKPTRWFWTPTFRAIARRGASTTNASTGWRLTGWCAKRPKPPSLTG